jgi:hypothetical protein
MNDTMTIKHGQQAKSQRSKSAILLYYDYLYKGYCE